MTNFRPYQTDNFRFDENLRKFSKQVENTVGKGEIARYEQFLLFPQFFQKACFPGVSKVLLCGNGLKVGILYRKVKSETNLVHYVMWIDDSRWDRIHSSLTAGHFFDNGNIVKQPVAWKEYCAEYCLKELQESMNRCTGHCYITEILLKTALKTIIQSVNQ